LEEKKTMDLEFTSEQHALREVAAKVISTSWTESIARSASEALDLDRERWCELGQLDLIGLAVPEALGGSGAGLLELQIVAEELGRSLARTPFLATVGLAVSALLASGDDALQQELLPGVCAGDTVLSVVASDAASGCPAVPAWSPTRMPADGPWTDERLTSSMVSTRTSCWFWRTIHCLWSVAATTDSRVHLWRRST
jgi:alkylation response protein AidB-like acyl-CoA dehydrogenase